ncbi:MAG: MotA/TolQ/ExbB proton channel family protein [Opitutaceae bacterium]|nr:MotA/TolQ/ExbB proton channel family protein [Opitutaceae bacterium]
MKYSQKFLLSLFFIGMMTNLLQANDGSIENNLNLWSLIQQGGWAMYPLGLCSLLLFFLAFHSYRETHPRKFQNESESKTLPPILAQRNLPQVSSILSSSHTVLGSALLEALSRAKPALPDANREKIEESLMESLEKEENTIGQWINYLNVIATVAPMIGLLGTVSGMIGAFQTISSGGMGRPELLAGDIGEALITTATGLVIGIPAMIAYFIFRNRLGNRMIEISQAATRFVDYLVGDLTESETDESNPS